MLQDFPNDLSIPCLIGSDTVCPGCRGTCSASSHDRLQVQPQLSKFLFERLVLLAGGDFFVFHGFGERGKYYFYRFTRFGLDELLIDELTEQEFKMELFLMVSNLNPNELISWGYRVHSALLSNCFYSIYRLFFTFNKTKQSQNPAK